MDLVAGLYKDGPLLKIFKFFGMTLEPVCVLTDFEKAITKYQYIELDLLGFGIVNPRIPGMEGFYLPCLSNPRDKSELYLERPDIDRLGRSMIFSKAKDDDGEAKEEDDKQRRLTTMAKCISAMVNGAWFFEDYATICKAVIYRTIAKYREQMGAYNFDSEIL